MQTVFHQGWEFMSMIGKGGQRNAKSVWNFWQEREMCVSGTYLNSFGPGVEGRCASLNTLLSCGNDVICEGRGGNRMQWGRDCKK